MSDSKIIHRILGALEADIVSFLNQSGEKTFNDISTKFPTTSEEKLLQALSSLESLQMIGFEKKTKSYFVFQSNLFKPEDYILLEGDAQLPVTIMTIPEQDRKIISRGQWYEFPLNFDERRIIWDINFGDLSLPSDKPLPTKNLTLSDLIRSSVQKSQKTSIKHNPDFDNLKDKVVPYSDKIKLYLNAIGEEQTSVQIMFQIPFGANLVFTGFNIISEISTQELINELNKPIGERNWSEAIKLNRIFEPKDFIFTKNEIPIAVEAEGEILFARITKTRIAPELMIFKMDKYGNSKKVEVLSFDNPEEFYQQVIVYLVGFAGSILEQNDMCVEYEV